MVELLIKIILFLIINCGLFDERTEWTEWIVMDIAIIESRRCNSLNL